MSYRRPEPEGRGRMTAMKWWGWGGGGVAFPPEDKPALAPFIGRVLGVDVTRDGARPAGFEDLTIPTATVPFDLPQASTDPLDRLVHARGKSLRDLVKHRRGDVGRVPDVVTRPRDE